MELWFLFRYFTDFQNFFVSCGLIWRFLVWSPPYCIASCTSQSQISVWTFWNGCKACSFVSLIVQDSCSVRKDCDEEAIPYEVYTPSWFRVLPVVPRCVHLTGNQRLPVRFLNQVIGPFASQHIHISRLFFGMSLRLTCMFPLRL